MSPKCELRRLLEVCRNAVGTYQKQDYLDSVDGGNLAPPPMRWHNVGQFASELSLCDTPPSPPAFNVGARVYVVQDFRELHHRVFFVVKRLQC